MPNLLTIEDIAELQDKAMDSPNPTRYSARLVAAVDEGRLAEPTDASLALATAADILNLAERTEEALRVAERALAVATETNAHVPLCRVTYGGMLLESDRRDEALAQLESLRPLHLLDEMEIDLLVETLVGHELLDQAHEWLTEAVAEHKKVMASHGADDDSDAADERVGLLYTLISLRHDVREDMELEHDEDDELADTLNDLMEQGTEATLLFWPQDEYTQVAARWPALGEILGEDWDHHRAIIERLMVGYDEAGGEVPELVAGTVAGLLAYAKSSGEDPDSADAQIGYARTAAGPFIEWPPGRNDACWCGSGDKYKKCCLPRSRQTT